MKSGEKQAMWFIVAGMVAIFGLTIYMESEHRKGDLGKKIIQLANEDLKTTSTSDGPGTAVIPKGLNPDALPDASTRGATLLVLYCAQCHELPTPLMHTAEEWREVVKRMQERMRAGRGGMLSRMIMPPEKDWDILTQYVTANAQKPLDPSTAGDLDTPEGRAFQDMCSTCHAMPDPVQHTAKEWPRVVVRMKANIRSAHLTPPDEETLSKVVGYLQTHAG